MDEENISVFALKNSFINFYLLKLQFLYQPIENILLKHITGVVLCFSKNTSVRGTFFLESRSVVFNLGVASLFSRGRESF